MSEEFTRKQDEMATLIRTRNAELAQKQLVIIVTSIVTPFDVWGSNNHPSHKPALPAKSDSALKTLYAAL